MSNSASSEAAKAVVHRNTEVQGKGNFGVFEELFADDFVDLTPQPTMIPDKHGARGLHRALREAFPDFYAVFHEIMTTFKTYHGPGAEWPEHPRRDRRRHARAQREQYWGVANLFSLMQQLGAWRPATQSLTSSPSSADLAAPAFPERSAGGNGTMTTQGLKMSNNRQIPLGSGLRKVERSDGEAFDVAGVRFTWKVKGEDTGYAFSMYEQKLEPGEGVPLHCHPYGEVFYALSGNVDFLRLTDAGEEWITCAEGETIIIPINAPHVFYNRTEKPARLLSISTQLHQAFFDAVGEADRADPLASIPRPQAMARIGEVAQQFDMHFVPFSPPPPRR